MKVKTGKESDGTRWVYDPFGCGRERMKVGESQLLFVYAGLDKGGDPINPEGYPSSPIGNYKSVWKEEFLWDASERGGGGSISRAALLNQMGNVLYNKYRSTILRCSSANASFARLVISIALNSGFKDTIISVDSSNLRATGLKVTAARGVLQRLHALGIIIYLRGRGTRLKEERSIPMGFVLHPCIERIINNYMGELKAGKLDLEGLQYIDVEVLPINKN